ncbi:hypothetical protein A2165_00065 [Candidatus Curtissbacteria bacterium RBG_13_40_7]|uniref:Phage holin family protein n=1 Tax=Candidatus Curtissbacteria bacterium RBG_13_40_7 TaxID=1797706 RepID=A0A1F5FXM8_9BACT|nr:MAG: hypothetical protein A2165_00065 [Candidatus Curtissbacteria bacterium RBG_13_40_7]
MKHYLKALIISSSAFYVAYRFVPTINFSNNPKNLLILIGGIFVISQIINPIFSLVLLPINHLTFGLVTLVLNIALIFALLNFLPDFNVSAYYFPGAIYNGIVLPAINFNEIATIILIASIITIVSRILHLIFE